MDESKAIIVNGMAVRGDKFGAEQMKFRLSALKARTGISEQALIFKFLNLGWNACDEFAEAKAEIDRLWESGERLPRVKKSKK